MSLIHPLRAHSPARPAPATPLLDGAPELALAQGRVHEACGPARRTFAVWLAARSPGTVFWIAPEWVQERLNADGLRAWLDPARIVFVTPKRGEDLLWSLEEVLRSGAVAFTVADLPALPNLTQVRRMHLAAETGGHGGAHLPLGLLLTPGDGGAAGVETRWHLSPRHGPGAERWHLERRRARTAPPKSWEIARQPGSGDLRLARV